MLAALTRRRSDTRAAAVDAGAVPVLMRMIRRGELAQQGAAMDALACVTFGHAGAAREAFQAGALPALRARLAPSSDFLPQPHYAARALASLLQPEALEGDAAALADACATAAPLVALLQLARQLDSDTCHTCRALAALAATNAGRHAAAGARAAPALVGVLRRAESARLQALAVEALAALARGEPESQRAIVAAGGRSLLQGMAASSTEQHLRERAADLLGLLAGVPEQTGGSGAGAWRTCAGPGCGATHGLRRCGGCGQVRYCSVDCQRAHWPEHQEPCRRRQAEKAAAAAQTGAAEEPAP